MGPCGRSQGSASCRAGSRRRFRGCDGSAWQPGHRATQWCRREAMSGHATRREEGRSIRRRPAYMRARGGTSSLPGGAILSRRPAPRELSESQSASCWATRRVAWHISRSGRPTTCCASGPASGSVPVPGHGGATRRQTLSMAGWWSATFPVRPTVRRRGSWPRRASRRCAARIRDSPSWRCFTYGRLRCGGRRSACS